MIMDQVVTLFDVVVLTLQDAACDAQFGLIWTG